MFVLFDSVWDPHPKLGKQHEPAQGLHNSGWVQMPRAPRISPTRHRQACSKAYVKGVDRRVQGRPARPRLGPLERAGQPQRASSYGKRKLEPPNKLELTLKLLPKSLRLGAIGRSVAAAHVRPLARGTWHDRAKLTPIEQLQLDQSDVISFHSYDDAAKMKTRVEKLRTVQPPAPLHGIHGPPDGSTFDPILGYFKQRTSAPTTGASSPARRNTIYPWDSWEKPYAAEPPVWFHDIFRPDGTPFDPQEVEYIRQITGFGENDSPPVRTWQCRTSRSILSKSMPLQ